MLRAHRQGQIDNAGLRSLSGLDTLNSSLVLRGLRDKGLLHLHSLGSRSYYTLPYDLTVGEFEPVTGELGPETGEFEPVTGELGPETGEFEPVTGELGPETSYGFELSGFRPELSGEFEPTTGEPWPETGELPMRVQERIARLGLRPPRERVRAVIQEICSQGIWVTSSEISQYLDRKQGNLTWNYLSPMVESGLLERRFPENVTHPQQAYRSVTSQLTLPLT